MNFEANNLTSSPSSTDLKTMMNKFPSKLDSFETLYCLLVELLSTNKPNLDTLSEFVISYLCEQTTNINDNTIPFFVDYRNINVNEENNVLQNAIKSAIIDENADERIWQGEYLYLISRLLGKTHSDVFYANIFIRIVSPYCTLFRAMRHIRENRNKLWVVDDLLDTIRLMEEFDCATLYSRETTDKYRRLKELEVSKSNVKWSLLIDPFELAESGYMRFTNPEVSSETHWLCNGITPYKRPTVGANAIVNKETFVKRFSTFTYGVFENAPNKDIPINEKFPFGNVVFAGGSIAHMLENELNAAANSDVDIFVFGDNYESCSVAFKKIITWFDTKGVYFAIKGDSVVNIYLPDIPRVFQIINTNNKHPYDVINNFDLSHIAWLAIYECGSALDCFIGQKKYTLKPLNYREWNVRGTIFAVDAIRNRVAVPIYIKKTNVERMMKAMYKGYHILKTPEIMTVLDISNVLANPTEVKRYVLEFGAHYYIKTKDLEEVGNEQQQKNHIEGMICKFAKTDNITNLSSYVIGRTIIYSNFSNDYQSTTFEDFSVTQIRHVQYNNYELEKGVPLKKLGGPVCLMSPFLHVSLVTFSEEDIIIDVTLNKSFKIFIDMIENQGINIYTRHGTIKSIISEKNTIALKFSTMHAQQSMQKGKILLRGSLGEPLNIFEDLCADDYIQFMFSINIYNKDRTSRFIEIKPIKITKKTAPENEVVENVTLNNVVENKQQSIPEGKMEVDNFDTSNVLDNLHTLNDLPNAVKNFKQDKQNQQNQQDQQYEVQMF